MKKGKTIDNLTDMRFGRLTVVRMAPRRGTRVRWICMCDCGNQTSVMAFNLKKRNTISCGCSRIEHGLSKSRVYGIWKGMFQRCENPDNDAYHNYGGRGIKVCDEWREFEIFFADMGHPPEGFTLERKDNNSSYCKANCIWTSRKEQLNNKRTNRFITAFGKTQSIALWAQELGLNENTLRNRLLRAKMDPEAALGAPMYAQQRGELPTK